MVNRFLSIALLLGLTAVSVFAGETLPPLTDGKPPRNLEELWHGYDPTREPLEVEVVHQWRRGDATVQMLVYTVGVFKGKKSRMGAYYAYPTKPAGKVPGILQMHGGGQRAMSEMVEAAAANGYACISINWGGKPMKDQEQGDPGADWGALDATQDGHNSHYGSLQPDDKTLDAVVSPRNSNWFLLVLAARRGLTFLEQRPEVDPQRLGVHGHSMGGKLTVMTAAVDPRVKAAVPSCGGTAAAPRKLRERPGSSCRPVNPEPLYHQTIDDINYSLDPHSLTRFWRTAAATHNDGAWSAKCPVISADMPLFVMANVYYPLEKQIIGPVWNRSSPETFLVSSEGLDFDPRDLKAAGVVATDTPQRLIEATFDTWRDWYRLEIWNDHHRQCVTRKIKDPKWRGPDGAKLAIDVLDPSGGKFAVTFEMNNWGAYEGMPNGGYYASKPLAKSDGWQTVEIGLEDLMPMDERVPQDVRSWRTMTEFGIVAMVRTRRNGQAVVLAGGPWTATRQLKNLRWVGGEYP